ncbi:voltage-dependent calcium channel gamma-1 subunit isoform X1 [Syngnathus scovelli]|uniref:voltage-dependent calcium channel gamma-1 subunit isoform X1 n=1 Tax=Syngnathus scovelli TaxID=161590 RepID=UPI00210F9FB4|nr:voltage-dependent calcium channel gamma-1 subunit isoform X2 [Syngnathus scovelli]
MLEEQATKVKMTWVVIVAGMSAMLAAVATDHWAVLSPRVEKLNATCQAVHFGLWRLCKKNIFMVEEDPQGKGCGPIGLPGAKNCSYFKHFTSGEEAEVFEVKTQKDHILLAEYNISAAAIAIFSLFFMILGTLCVICSFGKARDYLLRPAGMFFAFAGLCIVISVEVMRQSVKRMIASDETIWIEYYYSWSFVCACASFTLLILSGVALLLISMPQMPRNPWETCMDAEPDTLD